MTTPTKSLLRRSISALALALAACGPVSADTDALPETDGTTALPETSAATEPPSPTDPSEGPGTGSPDLPTESGGTGGGTCDGGAPAEGEAWGPCRDEDPLDPQWETRCDGGIHCTEVADLGTICLPACEFPPEAPEDGSCPCGAPGDSECAPLFNPARPDRSCRVVGECPEGMAEAEFVGCVWEGQGLAGGPAEPTPPDPSCGSWPPAAGEAWGPCLLDATCAEGSTCRVDANGGTICEPACDGPEILDCPGSGCFGFPHELFCTAAGSECEILCTWGAGDDVGSCPEGMACDDASRCAWI